MAYRANRDGELNDEELEIDRANNNNANDIRNAASIAIASKNPSAMLAGGTVKLADKLTDGKSTDALAKGLTRANKLMPGGRNIQDMLNGVNESGVGDAASTAANLENANTGGGQEGPPSSGDEDKEKTDEDGNKKSGFARIMSNPVLRTIIISSIPTFFIFFLFFAGIAAITGLIGDYDDAFGMSSTLNEETGGIFFTASNPEQQAFYDRVKQVKLSYQANGKNIDAMNVASVYHVLNNYGADIQYKDMTTKKIEQIADAMLVNNMYSEDGFKQNLINNIIPSYISGLSQGQKEDIANEITDYISRYNSLVGKESFDPYGGNYCGGTTSCKYDIKGYHINKKGNINENINVDNLYVRLMQCGTANGHNYGGTFGKPLENEDLVPFEKYILGVAYQEIGADAVSDTKQKEAFKAQMVAARSYILARHADMGGWRTLKQEGDKWVLQAASCTQDQVYCDPDKGCSSNNGQWSMVFSGTTKAKILKNSLPQDSPLRQYASQTSGEVLVNDQGYIIYSGYNQTEQNQMKALANNGLNYKQILLQVYNQGSRNYGAYDIRKSSCTTTGQTNCISSGIFSRWKQRGQPWSNIQIGTGSSIGEIGCLATSVSMLIAKSGVPTNVQGEFNPGSFVTFLNGNGGFDGGNFLWNSVSKVAPSWSYQGQTLVSGLTKEQKIEKIKEITSQPNTYAVAEVKGNTGQHWVAIDSVSGNTINMMDPSTESTDMWGQYNWINTSKIASFKVA